MSSEEHYLDAIDFEQEGELESALNSARLAVKADPKHSSAWWMVSNLEAQPKTSPDLASVSRALNACRKVVELDNSRVDAWVRGARLMVDHLGMHEQALAWWQECREMAPEESVPLVEQTTILAHMGLYTEARERMGALFEENLDIGNSQLGRIQQLHGTLEKAVTQDPDSHFKPWQANHPGWASIELRCNKPPVSENLIFMMTTVPMLMTEVFISRAVFGEGWKGFCFTSILILLTVVVGMMFTKKIYHRVNKPAFNLLRAIQVESTSGKLVISERVREAKLYGHLLGRYHPLSFQQRHEKIIESGKDLPRNWKITLPDFNSHLVEEDENEIGEDSELQSFEEE